MFKQFIHKFSEAEIFMTSSLWIFIIFFVLITIVLLKMKKSHVEYMKGLPLNDQAEEHSSTINELRR